MRISSQKKGLDHNREPTEQSYRCRIKGCFLVLWNLKVAAQLQIVVMSKVPRSCAVWTWVSANSYGLPAPGSQAHSTRSRKTRSCAGPTIDVEGERSWSAGGGLSSVRGLRRCPFVISNSGPVVAMHPVNYDLRGKVKYSNLFILSGQ